MFVFVSAAPLAYAGRPYRPEAVRMPVLFSDLPQAGQPFADVATAGQPSPEQLRAAKARGLKRIVNLRPHSEPIGFDEAALAAELGLDYINIPVAGAGDINLDKARALDAALQNAGGPVLVHCASSNRVGALLAVRAHALHGKNLEDALAIGRDGGLRAMEPAVRQLLGG